jgi:hypothetical protein
MISVASSRNELWSSMFDAIICGKYEYATCSTQHATRTCIKQHAARTCHVHHATCRSHDAECSATQSRGHCVHAVTHGMACARERRITHLAVLAEGPRLNLSGTTMDSKHATTTTRNTRQQPHRATRSDAPRNTRPLNRNTRHCSSSEHATCI